MITIRKIRRADLSRVLEMVQALSAYHDDEALLTFDVLERDTMGAHPWVRVLVAQEADALVGYAAMVPRARFHDGIRALDVHHLFVDENHRSNGIGRMLLDACGEAGRALGCANLTIGTAAENRRAQEIYKAYGFEVRESVGPQFKLMLN